ncbi:hypothetical protein D3C72_1775010 [compost metagenome]
MRPTKAPFQLALPGHQADLATRCRQADVTGHGQGPGGKGAGWRGLGHAQPRHHPDAFATVLFGDPVKPIPDALRQPGSGEEEQADALEKTLP